MGFQNGYALLVGIGSYADASWPTIPTTSTDAVALATALKDPSLCGYPEQQVQVLTGSSATRAQVLAALGALAKRISADDLVLLFYSGHGDFGEDGGYYLTTHDTRLTGLGKVAQGTGITHTELLECLRALPAHQVLVLFNACHAGVVSPVLGAERPMLGSNLPEATAAAALATGKGRVIITACGEDQVSYVGAGAQTIFGAALVNALNGRGVSSQGGFISVFDLYLGIYHAVGRAVEQDVPNDLKQRYGAAQEPELTILKGVGPFPVALFRGSAITTKVDPDMPFPANTRVRAVDDEYSQSQLQHIVGTGTGAIAASGSVAIGKQVNLHMRDGTVALRDAHINTVYGTQYYSVGAEGSSTDSPVTAITHGSNIATPSDGALRAELRQLGIALVAELRRVPARYTDEVEAIAAFAQGAIDSALQEPLVKAKARPAIASLDAAAQPFRTISPSVDFIARRIGEIIRLLLA